MSTRHNYPEYAAIETHIRAARIERVPAIAEAIVGFIAQTWSFVQEPPAPAPILIDRRRESRGDATRLVKKLATR
jgi:hypothetical protein